MSQSLWDSTAEQLLSGASSSDPTLGGGATAAVATAFGLSLVRMAIEVTIVSDVQAGRDLLRGVAPAARGTADINLATSGAHRLAEAPPPYHRPAGATADTDAEDH